jgi:YfiH family protein
MFPLTVSKDIEIIQAPQLAECPGLIHAFSTRNGGVSHGPYRSLNLALAEDDTLKNILINRKRFCNTLNFAPSDIAQAEQVHGNQVRIVENSGPNQACDALLTNRPHIFLSVKTADCAPVLLYDPIHQAVGAVHAGWRGTVSGIIGNAINAMRSNYNSDPQEIIAAIGPALHSCCYAVKNDVAEQFTGEEIIRRDGLLYLDLIAAVRNRLLAAGLQPGQIEESGYCTACQADKFYSYRRDGVLTGRMLAVIGLNNRNNGSR